MLVTHVFIFFVSSAACVPVTPESYQRGGTLLHVAAAAGHMELAIALLNSGANVNALDICGNTPLYEACLHNRVCMVKMLVSRRAFVGVNNVYGLTALHAACINGHVETARILLDAALYVNACGRNFPDVPLGLEAEFEAQIPVQGVREWRTPLHFAAQGGHLECARLLLDRKADVNALSATYDTPLFLALREHQYEMASFLKEAGGWISPHSLEWTICAGDIILARSLMKWNTCQPHMSTLLKSVADIRMAKIVAPMCDLSGPDGTFAFAHAVYLRNIETARLLLSLGAKAEESYDISPCKRIYPNQFLGYGRLQVKELCSLVINAGSKPRLKKVVMMDAFFPEESEKRKLLGALEGADFASFYRKGIEIHAKGAVKGLPFSEGFRMCVRLGVPALHYVLFRIYRRDKRTPLQERKRKIREYQERNKRQLALFQWKLLACFAEQLEGTYWSTVNLDIMSDVEGLLEAVDCSPLPWETGRKLKLAIPLADALIEMNAAAAGNHTNTRNSMREAEENFQVIFEYVSGNQYL